MHVKTQVQRHIAIVADDGDPLTAAAVIEFADTLRKNGVTGPWPLDDCTQHGHRLCYTIPTIERE